MKHLRFPALVLLAAVLVTGCSTHTPDTAPATREPIVTVQGGVGVGETPEPFLTVTSEVGIN